jgi:hypothetical protein
MTTWPHAAGHEVEVTFALAEEIAERLKKNDRP